MLNLPVYAVLIAIIYVSGGNVVCGCIRGARRADRRSGNVCVGLLRVLVYWRSGRLSFAFIVYQCVMRFASGLLGIFENTLRKVWKVRKAGISLL